MGIHEDIVYEMKRYVEANNLFAMQILWEECQYDSNVYRAILWDTLFYDVYCYARQYQRHDMVQWLMDILQTFDSSVQDTLLSLLR
jgi:hypothetical protein